MSVRPSPIAIEQADPGGVSWTKRRLVADGVIVVGVEAHLLDVEGLGAVDVGDRDGDELELQIHGALPSAA